MSAKPLEKKQCMKQIALAAYAAAVFALLGAVCAYLKQGNLSFDLFGFALLFAGFGIGAYVLQKHNLY